MKLYYMPGTCSLAPHIVANEAGVAFELIKVNRASKKTEQGEDYLSVNPNGYVPALTLDDGETLTETSFIVQYLADRNPASGLIPAAGTMERYRVQQALAFIATELHKSFGPLQAGHAGGDQGCQPCPSGTADRLSRRSARRRSFLLGETFHGGRCLPVDRPRLGRACRSGSLGILQRAPFPGGRGHATRSPAEPA